ncbi:MAG: hypothetical protein H6812_00830 [Phycisphaeraceae bacterium]|nr:hypothetical protein [Phycisphaerales bacterium]MCB9841781.1 hypothetical protein [Phycisphaeraceae bacterium]
MRRIRAKFGRLSVVPAAVGVGVVLLLGVVFFALCVWGIGVIWPRVSVDRVGAVGVALVCVQRQGASIEVIGSNDPKFRAVLNDPGVRDIDRVVIYPMVRTRSVGNGDTAWSDMWIENTLIVRGSADFRGAGMTVTLAHERAVLAFLQANHAALLPVELRKSSSLVVRKWSRQGLIYNGLVGGALVVALGAAVFGVWRVIGAERRFREWVLTNCAYCGYSLEGLTKHRCPECGRVRMPLWR